MIKKTSITHSNPNETIGNCQPVNFFIGFDLLDCGRQERELKLFREGLKQEVRLLKQESDLMARDQRKTVFRIKRQQLEAEQVQFVPVFSLPPPRKKNPVGEKVCFLRCPKGSFDDP